MNVRAATVADLMGMQNANLHNLPEVCQFSSLSAASRSRIAETNTFRLVITELRHEILYASSLNFFLSEPGQTTGAIPC